MQFVYVAIIFYCTLEKLMMFLDLRNKSFVILKSVFDFSVDFILSI